MPGGRGRSATDRGQATIEFLGIFPLVLVVVLMCLQAFITVVGYERTHNAARAGARLMSMNGLSAAETRQATLGALPDWLVKEPSVPVCEPGQDPADDDCVPEHRCVRDGEQKPWETTCVFVNDPATVTVQTEIPLLFPGAPLIYPIESTVEMPS